MTVDEEIQRAGSRLGAVPITVPDLGRLVRHHRHRRILAVGGVTILVLAVSVAAIGYRNNPDRVSTETADVGPPATSSTVGLAQEGVWPGEDRRFASASDLASAFASEVLRWDDADVVVEPAEPNSPTGMTISDGSGQSVRAVAAPLRGVWTLMQIGDAPISARAHEAGTRLMIPLGPPGTVAVRWWVLASGQELTGVHPDPAQPLVVPIDIDQVDTTLVVYVDNRELVLGAVGSGSGGSTPPTTPITGLGV
jgi:hypothetical protein